MAALAVHVTPKSGKDEVVGWRGDELQVRVAVAPEGGKANAATCAVVASALKVPKSAVRVIRGATSRHKMLEIVGIDDRVVRETFGQPDSSLF